MLRHSLKLCIHLGVGADIIRPPILSPLGEGIYCRGCYQPFYLWIYILVISGSPSPWTMQRNSQPYRS